MRLESNQQIVACMSKAAGSPWCTPLLPDIMPIIEMTAQVVMNLATIVAHYGTAL
jgi:hypothetical protein